jgi:hypothetical protein
MLRRSIIIRCAISICECVQPGHLARLQMENFDETVILAAVAAMSLGVGAAYAAGGPVGWEPQSYGTQATSDLPVVQFLGKGTVVGKMLDYNSNYNGVSAATSSTRGG